MGLPQDSLRQAMQNSVLGGQFPSGRNFQVERYGVYLLSGQTQILSYQLAIRKQFSTSNALTHTKYPAEASRS
jgi:hypothetical protein